MNGSNYVKLTMRSSALLKIENDHKYCFLWSILAHPHRFENSHPNRVSNSRKYFNERNLDGFDFS